MNPLSSREKKEILEKRNIIKDQINQFVKWYSNIIPELEPTTRISKLTNEIFVMLKGNLKVQPKGSYDDKNFPRLLELMRKLFIFLIETDDHYEKWVGYFYIHSMLKTSRIYEAWCDTRTTVEINFEEFVAWFLETK